MSKNTTVGIERIIAKIDNDFNLDNSDWIPRVGAWCIDAMSQLDVLHKVKRKRELIVSNRIAVSPCDIIDDDLEVYDENGCKVSRLGDNCECSFTGDSKINKSVDCNTNGAKTLEIGNESHDSYETIAITLNDKYPYENTKVVTRKIPAQIAGDGNRNYVKLNNRQLELNFDTNSITIVNKEIETKYSDVYKIELPVIPDNGILLEALAYYCMYKFLCRGYKHPVFNLSASQYGTNPYYEWMQLKDKAKRSVLNDGIDFDNASFQSYFFDSTFHNA